jgi:hypothetical protein
MTRDRLFYNWLHVVQSPWTLVTAGFMACMQLFAVAMMYGLGQFKSGYVVPASLFLGSGAMWGMVYPRLVIEILSRPFSYSLPGHTKLSFWILMLPSLGANLALVIVFCPPVSWLNLYHGIGFVLMGTGAYLFMAMLQLLATSQATLSLMPLLILGALTYAFNHSFGDFPWHALPFVGLLMFPITYYIFEKRAFHRRLTESEALRAAMTMDGNWMQRSQTLQWKNMKGTSLSERLGERFFFKTHKSTTAPWQRLTAGLCYGAFGRVNLRSVGSSLLGLVGILAAQIVMKSPSETLTMFYLFSVITPLVDSFLTLPPKHFVAFPFSRTSRWRALAVFNMTRAVFGLFLSGALLGIMVAVIRLLWGPDVELIFGGTRIWIGLVSLPLFISPYLMMWEPFMQKSEWNSY